MNTENNRPEQDTREKKEIFTNDTLKELKSFAVEILITIVVVFFIISFVAQPTTVDGSSMSPTLEDKDQLIIEKISERFVGYNRYDIVVFPYDKEAKKYYIKRIIGLPGETVDIVEGRIYIDGERLNEPVTYDLIREMGSDMLPIEVPEGQYFVLGDNRNHSKDSRFMSVGFVDGEDILGKGYIRLWPFDGFGFIK